MASYPDQLTEFQKKVRERISSSIEELIVKKLFSETFDFNEISFEKSNDMFKSGNYFKFSFGKRLIMRYLFHNYFYTL